MEEYKKCCKIILESAEKMKADASNIANEIKMGKIKEANASSMVIIVNSWKLLPNKCDNCIEREKFMLKSIERIENNRQNKHERQY